MCLLTKEQTRAPCSRCVTSLSERRNPCIPLKGRRRYPNYDACRTHFLLSLQGQPALQNLDVVALTGGTLRPIILTADATVSDGTLEIEFLNNAIAQAIYVYPGLVSLFTRF